MLKSCAVVATVLALLASFAAPAATKTTPMSVSATLVDTCLVTATSLIFPNYVPAAGTLKATSTISLRCTNGVQYGVGMSAGTTAGESYAQRLLANGANTLQYNIYTSSAYSAVWGDGSGTTQIVSGNAAGFATPITLTVYGELPDSAANQVAVPGNYSDTILVVLTY
jgi:spore coat protein U-like protein